MQLRQNIRLNVRDKQNNPFLSHTLLGFTVLRRGGESQEQEEEKEEEGRGEVQKSGMPLS